MRTLLRLGTFGLFASLAAFAAVSTNGCTVLVNDAPLDDAAADTIADEGVDTATDTGTPDVSTDTAPDAPVGYAVVVPATALIGGSADDIRDYNGGSSYSDIVSGGRIAYAIASYGSVESNKIGENVGGKLADGRLVGLPTDKGELTITVTGYLRGMNGDGTATPNKRVAWATTTCKATPSTTADVTATCAKLALIPDLKGILFSSDVLPPDYCTGKGATDFELLRARLPYDGTATVSKTTDDCLGVIWIPESEFAASEVSGVTKWSLSAEVKSSSTACTIAPPGCTVDRGTGTSKLDVYVVGDSCRLTNTSTGGTCF